MSFKLTYRKMMTLFWGLLLIGGISVSLIASCHAPYFIFDSGGANRPDKIVERLIAQRGGLPKTGFDLSDVNANAPQIYPVNRWAVSNSTVTGKALFWTPDDDPTYHHKFEIYVTYEDGDHAIINWSSWSYGRVLYPFVISQGSGPPGRLSLISHTPRTVLNNQ